MDEKDFQRIQAVMDRESTVVRNRGKKIEVSEMELVILCNLARLNCMDQMAMGLTDDDLIAEIEEQAESLIVAIRTRFSTEQQPDGLQKLMQSCVAILQEERLSQYLVN